MYVCIYIYIYICLFIYLFIYLYNHLYLCIYIYIHVYTCLCVCVCVCVRACRSVGTWIYRSSDRSSHPSIHPSSDRCSDPSVNLFDLVWSGPIWLSLFRALCRYLFRSSCSSFSLSVLRCVCFLCFVLSSVVPCVRCVVYCPLSLLSVLVLFNSFCVLFVLPICFCFFRCLVCSFLRLACRCFPRSFCRSLLRLPCLAACRSRRSSFVNVFVVSVPLGLVCVFVRLFKGCFASVVHGFVCSLVSPLFHG